MSRSDMINRTRMGLSYKIEDCAPKKVSHDVSVIFSTNLPDGPVTINIVETKAGGRTYSTVAEIDNEDFKEISNALAP